MKRSVLCGLCLVCLIVVASRVVSAQDNTSKVNVQGTWDVTITESSASHANATGQSMKQQWNLEQKGEKVTGKVTAGGDSQVEGDIEGLSGDVMRVEATDHAFMVHATVVGDMLIGTMRGYKEGDRKEKVFSAKRVRSN